MKVADCLLLQVAGILVFCWLCDAAAGGCSRYGHACWGGHGKRSSRPAKPQVQGIPLNGALPDELDDVQDTPDDQDDALPPEAVVDAGGRRSFRAESHGMNGMTDYISSPSDQTVQSPETGDESDEEVHRLRFSNHHGYRNKEKDLQVLIIPDDVSPSSNFHIYQILGRNPRKRV